MVSAGSGVIAPDAARLPRYLWCALLNLYTLIFVSLPDGPPTASVVPLAFPRGGGYGGG